MRRVLHQIWRGMGHLPQCGDHPGNVAIVFLLVAGAAMGGWRGIAIMAAIFVPMYLGGAYGRAEEEERLNG